MKKKIKVTYVLQCRLEGVWMPSCLDTGRNSFKQLRKMKRQDVYMPGHYRILKKTVQVVG